MPRSHDEREAIALEAVAAGPRPTGRRLTDDELERLMFHRLHPRLAATVARLLALPDPGPVPGPSSVVV